MEVVQWVSLTFYPFLICYLSHSGSSLSSLNLVLRSLSQPCLWSPPFSNANTLSAPRGMATILAFDRKCSTWCAVQYLPLQGLRQCYINLWRTWRSLSSRRCNTYTRWDKNQMRILIFMIWILFIGISFSGWGNRWAPLSPVRSLSYSWYLHLHQLLFRYIEGRGNSPNQTLSPLILFH